MPLNSTRGAGSAKGFGFTAITRALPLGVFGGGGAPSDTNTIDFINIASAGNATDFGDLTLAMNNVPSGQNSSTTRGIFGGGYRTGAGNNNTVNFITFATKGNATDFGDNFIATRGAGQLSSSTRGINGGGISPGNPLAVNEVLNVISFITIASTGNYADFGDCVIHSGQRAGLSNSTRGIFAGGYAITPAPGDPRPSTDAIDYFTIASAGNATDFGNLTSSRRLNSGLGNTTKGLISMGSANPAATAINTIDKITYATTGNATDFGDLIQNSNQNGGGVDNNVRGVFAGGALNPLSVNVLQFVTIASDGNATDFGDLTTIRRLMSSAGNLKASNQ